MTHDMTSVTVVEHPLVGHHLARLRSVETPPLEFRLLVSRLAVLLAETMLSTREVSTFLQKYVHLVVGPILLLLGMFLVGLITTSIGGAVISQRMQKRVDSMGIWGALLLGILFAVSFCPTSAVWFFGLLTLIMGSEAEAISGVLDMVGIELPAASLPGGPIVLSLIYGVGTAVPVLLVAVVLAYSAQSVGKTYNVLAKVEWWARMVSGWILILIGIYFSLEFCFGIPIRESLGR